MVSPKVGLCPFVNWTESHLINHLIFVPITTTSFFEQSSIQLEIYRSIMHHDLLAQEDRTINFVSKTIC